MSEIATTAPRRLAAAAGTHCGRVRTGNEDRHYIDVDRGIFLVADGVGGHAAGEVAAVIAVDVIVQRLERPIWTAAQRVREAIALANNEIFKQSEASPAHAGMTCVLTLALLDEQTLTIGHVGDSRLYTITRAGIRKVTRDHSPIGEREDAGEISELDAMRHPRRNEVFRDVGSAFHEPDDEQFIEITETPFETDSAFLLCSDGLSDMLSSADIEQIVRQHAGHPDDVVGALILAANEAGGRDNITVIYVEGADFGASSRWRATAPTEDLSAPTAEDASVEPIHRSSGASRAGWLAGGVVLGVALGLGLSLIPAIETRLTGPRARTLVVGRTAPSQFASITRAVAAAASGDVVQVEPGEYAETVALKDGVNLVARVPGSVVLVAPPGQRAWVSLTADGRLGNRVSGVRVLGRPQAPIAVGMRLGGHDLLVDDVTVEGVVAVGMDLVNDGTMIIRASRFTDVTGLAIRLGPATRPIIRQNVFANATPPLHPSAIDVANGARPQLTANLFVGYPKAVQWPAAPAGHWLRDNFVSEAPRNGR
jgi:PPM family protein phosphatase